MPRKRNISSAPKSAYRSQQVLAMARDVGILRPRDLDQHGIPREYLVRLSRGGQLERVGRGLYRLPEASPSEYHTLVLVSKRLPGSIVCLLSALRFHNLTTQSPTEVWVALDRKAWLTTVKDLPVRIVRFSGPALRRGIEEHMLEGVKVRVTTPAKTVADCFKYRNKIGLDVALEALREGWRERRFTMDALTEAAGVDRVANVMRPYLDSIA